MIKNPEGTEQMGMTVPEYMIVVGMPRSGTTWLAKMLDVSPGVLYLHEPDSNPTTQGWPLFVEDGHIKQDMKNQVNWFFRALPENATPRMYARPPFYPKVFLPHGWRERLYLVSLIDKLFPSVYKWLTFKKVFKLQKTFPLLIKTVESFGRIPLFSAVLQNFRLIHIVRHPAAVVNSVLKGEKQGRFKDNRSIADSVERLSQLCQLKQAVEHDLCLEKLRSYHPVQVMAWWWVICTEKSILDCQSTDRGKIIIYEELCSRPMEVMKGVYSYLGLKFDEHSIKCIEALCNKHSQRYYSVHRIPEKAAKAWKNELNRAYIRMIEQVLSKSWLAELWG